MVQTLSKSLLEDARIVDFVGNQKIFILSLIMDLLMVIMSIIMVIFYSKDNKSSITLRF